MTYKTRLLIYVGTLILLIIGMMALSFRMASNVILADAEEHLRHAALRKEDKLRSMRQELLHYTDLIGGDLRLREYLYIILEVGASSDGLSSYYDRQFGALPTNCRVIMSSEGEVLLGEEFPLLIEESRKRVKPGKRGYFYFNSPQGVVLAAMGPVMYQGQQLATAIVARYLHEEWLTTQERRSGDYVLFFEKGGEVLWSSNPAHKELLFDENRKMLHGQNEYFRLHEVELESADSDLPRLWFGISETRLMEMLSRYEGWIYWIASLGGIIVLVFGWLMLRNFNRSLEQLMDTTEEIMNGKLPVIRRSSSNTELDRLVNRFGDVLDALRREQEEVKRVHSKLQETAITDSLTNLYNRRYLQEIAPSLLAQVVRDRRYLTAILLDLDYFKHINDRYGHLAGDAVLVRFAGLLKDNSRSSDYLFRIGGEEFLILNLADEPDGSVVLAEKIRELVHGTTIEYQEFSIPISVSSGVSCCFGQHGEGSLSRLMREADTALYQAKAQGRNRVVLHASCHSAIARSREKNQRALALVRDSSESSSVS